MTACRRGVGRRYKFPGYGFQVWDSAPQAFWEALSEN